MFIKYILAFPKTGTRYEIGLTGRRVRHQKQMFSVMLRTIVFKVRKSRRVDRTIGKVFLCKTRGIDLY